MQTAYAIAINPSPLLILARHEIRIKTTLKTIGLCTALRAGGALGAEESARNLRIRNARRRRSHRQHQSARYKKACHQVQKAWRKRMRSLGQITHYHGSDKTSEVPYGIDEADGSSGSRL